MYHLIVYIHLIYIVTLLNHTKYMTNIETDGEEGKESVGSVLIGDG